MHKQEKNFGEPLTYSVAEAAHRLGVSVPGAYVLAKRGDLPVIRLGSRILVIRKKFDALFGAE